MSRDAFARTVLATIIVSLGGALMIATAYRGDKLQEEAEKATRGRAEASARASSCEALLEEERAAVQRALAEPCIAGCIDRREKEITDRIRREVREEWEPR